MQIASWENLSIEERKVKIEKVLSEVYDLGSDDGYAEGYDNGYAEGYNQGKEVGFHEGFVGGDVW